jgi:hypothetical protein
MGSPHIVDVATLHQPGPLFASIGTDAPVVFHRFPNFAPYLRTFCRATQRSIDALRARARHFYAVFANHFANRFL